MPEGPREAGREAVERLRRGAAQRVVEVLAERDPSFLDSLVEVGVVDREFVERPADAPVRRAPPLAVIERLLERSIERRPSLMAAMGLSAIQLLSQSGADESADTPSPSRLTVVFTDLEGFTPWTARNGDEAASLLVAEHHRAVGPVVRSRGGRVVKRLGDGLLLTFPEPEAAVLCCLELVDIQPPPLRLRAGVHCGDVVVLRDDVVGHVVNVAARVAEAAKGAEVLVTGDVREAVSDHLPAVEFGRASSRRLKGLEGSLTVCSARPAGRAPQRRTRR